MRRTLVFLLLLAACNWHSPTEPERAQCTSPAPFYQYTEHAPGYLVMLHEGVGVATTVKQYEARYSFHAVSVWENAGGFFVENLSLRTIAALRCEPEVKFISENSIAHNGGVTGTTGTSPAAR
jgi:hypothetical protein